MSTIHRLKRKFYFLQRCPCSIQVVTMEIPTHWKFGQRLSLGNSFLFSSTHSTSFFLNNFSDIGIIFSLKTLRILGFSSWSLRRFCFLWLSLLSLPLLILQLETLDLVPTWPSRRSCSWSCASSLMERGIHRFLCNFSMLNYSNNSHRVEIIWETNFCLLSNYCIHLRPQNQSVSSKITVSALLTRKCLSAWMESNLTNWAYTVWTLKVWSEGSATPPGWDSNANGRYLSGKFWREMRPQRTLASQLATALFDERKKLLFDWLVLAPL